MGVSMSKSDNSCSEDSGVIYIKDSPPPTYRSQSARSGGSNQSRSRASYPKESNEEPDVVQILCPEDDEDPEESEWKDIYQRLKSNKSLDLHTAKPDIRPVFTSSVNERPTRITSANFSPHAVIVDKEDARPLSVISALQEPVDDDTELDDDDDDDDEVGEVRRRSSDEERNTSVLSQNIDRETELFDTLKRSTDYISDAFGNDYDERDGETIDLKVPSGVSLNIEAPAEDEELEWKEDNVENALHSGEDLLYSSSKSFGFLSPQPYAGASSNDEDDLWDPFDGLGFPRERTSSFGSVSIVSVKDFKDELYNEYFYEIRRWIRNYGYFEKFPSPSLLRDAQRTYRQLNLPTPVNDDGKVLPHPPKDCRDTVFREQDFGDVDQRALFAPEGLTEKRLVEVATYLCSGLDDDVQKVRAIYTWTAARQVSQENLKNSKARKIWCKTFRKLCRFARIETKLVQGIIRGKSYLPGEDLEKLRGCWVSVLVNQSWWVVDPVVINFEDCDSVHSNIVTKEHPQSQARTASNMEDTLPDFEGFFKDPEELIFDYFPDTDYWQLLARPVSKNEFTDMAVLGNGFFKLRMKLLNQERSIVIVEAESVLISLGFPDKTHRQFMYSLLYCNNTSLDSETVTFDDQKVSLNQFVFLETTMEKSQVNIRVHFPHTGSYILNIYGSGESSSKTLHICSYRLVYSNPKRSNPFPPTNRQEWGPGIDALRLGLSPVSHKTGEIVVDKKVVQVAFQDARRLQFKFDLRQDGKVVNKDDIKLRFLRNKDEDIVFIIEMGPDISDVFTLNLYARPNSSRSFFNFCTYLVKKVEFWPEVAPSMKNTEKKATTHLYNYRHEETVECEPTEAPDNGRLSLKVDTAEVSKLVVELKLQDKQELNFSEHARHWIQDNTGYIDLNFPRAGKYKVRVLGRCRQTNHFKTLHEEKLHVTFPSDKWSPFPKTLEEWNSYYKIEEPLTQHLAERENILFRLVINGAHDVALLAANGWYHMELEDGVWTGKVYTGPRSTRCRLVARFEIGSEKFTELLMFKVISSEDLEVLDERQETLRSKAVAKTTKI